MYTKLNFFVRIENGICNNDDDGWRFAKRLKFGVQIIREVGYISNVLTYIKVQLYKRTSKELTS